MAALSTRGRIVQSWLYTGLAAIHSTGFLFSPLPFTRPLLYFRFATNLDLPPWLTHGRKQNSENKWSSQWLTLTIPVDKESKWWSTFLPSTEIQLAGEHELGGQEGPAHHKQKAGMDLHDLLVPTSDIRHSIQSVFRCHWERCPQKRNVKEWRNGRKITHYFPILQFSYCKIISMQHMAVSWVSISLVVSHKITFGQPPSY